MWCAGKTRARYSGGLRHALWLGATSRALPPKPFRQRGTPVWLAEIAAPTPALSLLVRQRGAAGGIQITASHNPLPLEWHEVQGELRKFGIACDRRADGNGTRQSARATAFPPLPPRKESDPFARYSDAVPGNDREAGRLGPPARIAISLRDRSDARRAGAACCASCFAAMESKRTKFAARAILFSAE